MRIVVATEVQDHGRPRAGGIGAGKHPEERVASPKPLALNDEFQAIPRSEVSGRGKYLEIQRRHLTDGKRFRAIARVKGPVRLTSRLVDAAMRDTQPTFGDNIASEAIRALEWNIATCPVRILNFADGGEEVCIGCVRKLDVEPKLHGARKFHGVSDAKLEASALTGDFEVNARPCHEGLIA